MAFLSKKEWVHYCLFQALRNICILSVSIYVEDLKVSFKTTKPLQIIVIQTVSSNSVNYLIKGPVHRCCQLSLPCMVNKDDLSHSAVGDSLSLHWLRSNQHRAQPVSPGKENHPPGHITPQITGKIFQGTRKHHTHCNELGNSRQKVLGLVVSAAQRLLLLSAPSGPPPPTPPHPHLLHLARRDHLIQRHIYIYECV